MLVTTAPVATDVVSSRRSASSDTTLGPDPRPPAAVVVEPVPGAVDFSVEAVADGA
jgi:hypothetical protein